LRVLSMRTSIFAVSLLLIAGSASATLVAVGDPFDSDSWNQQFTAASPYGLDHVQLLMGTVGASFESIRSFTDEDGETIADWQGSISGNHQLLWADGGTSVNSLDFLVTFAGAKRDPLTFHFQAYKGSLQVTNADATWIPVVSSEGLYLGGSWVIGPGYWTEVQPIPEPIGMVMLGCAGAGMFAARKLRGKRAT